MNEESNDLVVKPHPEKISFDDVLKELGEFGRYQKLVYFFCCIPYVFLAMLLMGWVFVGANVDFVCKRDSNKTVRFFIFFSNLTNLFFYFDLFESRSMRSSWNPTSQTSATCRTRIILCPSVPTVMPLIDPKLETLSQLSLTWSVHGEY